MSNTPKWTLDPDLTTIREMATMWKPDFRDYDQGAHYHHAKRRYDAHVASLKFYPAEKFTPEYAGKELEENWQFAIINGIATPIISATPLPPPLSNTANPKGEEKDWVKRYDVLRKYLNMEDAINKLVREVQSSTPPTESEPDYWKKRCEAAEKLLDCVGNQINKRFVGYTEWESLKNQTHLRECKNKEL